MQAVRAFCDGAQEGEAYCVLYRDGAVLVSFNEMVQSILIGRYFACTFVHGEKNEGWHGIMGSEAHRCTPALALSRHQATATGTEPWRPVVVGPDGRAIQLVGSPPSPAVTAADVHVVVVRVEVQALRQDLAHGGEVVLLGNLPNHSVQLRLSRRRAVATGECPAPHGDSRAVGDPVRDFLDAIQARACLRTDVPEAVCAGRR